MIDRGSRIGAGLIMALIVFACLAFILSAPAWGAWGLALMTYFHIINAAAIYNAHCAVLNAQRPEDPSNHWRDPGAAD